MTATVDSTPTLPEPQAQPNAPILTTNGNQGGMLYTARSLNTAYEKARTMLVAQWNANFGNEIIFIASGGGTASARWRVKTLGFSGGEVATETVEAWVSLGWFASGGSPSATVQLDVTGASTTESETLTYSTDTVGTNEWIQFADLTIDDDQEYVDVVLSALTNADMDNFYVDGFVLMYKGARTSLVADAYTNGFTPVHDFVVDENSPCATFALYHMHANAEVIYKTRQGGNLIADYLVGISNASPTTKIYDVWIPPGIVEIRGWFYCSGSASLSDDIDVTLGNTTDTINRGAGLGAWVSVDFDVDGLQGTWQTLTVECVGGACSVTGVCAYARDIA